MKFHWDRLAKGDDTSSCWVRVSSAWAGQGFGGVQIPRIGDEVVIDFINGDPDRPIITGRVYNEANMPPWELPGDATRMGFMTQSKDGNIDNSSFLFFEDSAGAESVQMHSEKDMMLTVENDQNITIDGNRTTEIKKAQTDTVTGAVTLTYNSTRDTTVTDKVTNTFKNGEKTTIAMGRALTITSGGDDVEIIGKRKTIIDGDEDHTVLGKLTEKIGSGIDTTIKSGRTETIDGGVKIDLNSGDWVQNVNSGNFTLNCPHQITLKSDCAIKYEVPDSKTTATESVDVYTPKYVKFVLDTSEYLGNHLQIEELKMNLTAVSAAAEALTLRVRGAKYEKVVFNLSKKDTKVANNIFNISVSVLVVVM